MKKKLSVSAGVFLVAGGGNDAMVFLVTPGGPLWKNRVHWGMPKGHIEPGEDVKTGAKREFDEETGIKLREKLEYLGKFVRTKGKFPKVLIAYTAKGTGNEKFVKSNMFELEWPPHSGKIREFPEIREGRWFELEEALGVIAPSQREFIEELIEIML